MVNGGLFEDGGTRRPKKKPAETDGAVVRLETLFVEEHVRRWSCKPLLAIARDRRHLKDLVAQTSEAEVADLIKLFFTTSDSLIVRSDYSVQRFYMLASHLRLLEQRRNGSIDERTRENIDAAARATGRRLK